MHARALTTALLLSVAASLGPAPRAGEATPAEIGRQLITKLGCPGCHETEHPAFSGLPKAGPDLRRIAAKTDPGWVESWIRSPRELRPTTWMPHLLDDAEPEELRGIVAYLWANDTPAAYPAPPAGDAARGERLFNEVGCSACHLRDAAARRQEYPEPYRLQGPNLAGLGGKVDAGWLFAWIKDPKAYAPETLMPRLPLSDGQAADLTAFLMADGGAAREPGEPPATDDEAALEAGRDAIEIYGCFGCHEIAGFEDAGPYASEMDPTAGFVGHGMSGLPDFALSTGELERIAAAFGGGLDEDDPALVQGRKLTTLYNCRGCHLVEGRGRAVQATIEEPGMLPPELRGEGSRVQSGWLAGYLLDPEQLRLRPWLRVRMPAFGFSQQEAGRFVDYFTALAGEPPLAKPVAAADERRIAIGRELVELLSCASCHPTGEEAAGASALAAQNLAPPLELASERLRYGWIPYFIREPQELLPGSKMPTFFLQPEPGRFDTPFPDGLAAPVFADSRERLLRLTGSEEALDSYLNDVDAMIDAMTDYIWSLGR
jgi:cytochrome c2